MTGAYGNRVRMWRTVEAWDRSGFEGNVVIRYLGEAGKGPCLYDVSPRLVEWHVEQLVKQGWERDRIYLNEALNGSRQEIQGELYNGVYDAEGTLYPFYYSRAKHPMRQALQVAGRHTFGHRSLRLLEQAMTPSSWADFEVILERYSDHVIEVSVFRSPLGDLPGRNAIVWEVRRY